MNKQGKNPPLKEISRMEWTQENLEDRGKENAFYEGDGIRM